jgi:hypothetical protein
LEPHDARWRNAAIRVSSEFSDLTLAVQLAAATPLRQHGCHVHRVTKGNKVHFFPHLKFSRISVFDAAGDGFRTEERSFVIGIALIPSSPPCSKKREKETQRETLRFV